ncbi:hypothetical protein L596_006495 [Steinernema carpocapsae]|uniref:Uncharacterized protein n=1 Tax=Steinernema carpocapsae TaxID=34508 RepID=A0A4U8VAR9_STECR|nr:hypothetical protein L596_006495 [Steinernema carpocapsae]
MGLKAERQAGNCASFKIAAIWKMISNNDAGKQTGSIKVFEMSAIAVFKQENVAMHKEISNFRMGCTWMRHNGYRHASKDIPTALIITTTST